MNNIFVVPAILPKAIKKTHASIIEFLERLMTKIYKITAFLVKASIVKDIIPFGIYSLGNVIWATEMLTTWRQHEVYIRLFYLQFSSRNFMSSHKINRYTHPRRKLLSDTERCEKETKCLMERLQARLFKIHDTVRYRTAIPTVQVYVCIFYRIYSSMNHLMEIISLRYSYMLSHNLSI